MYVAGPPVRTTNKCHVTLGWKISPLLMSPSSCQGVVHGSASGPSYTEVRYELPLAISAKANGDCCDSRCSGIVQNSGECCAVRPGSRVHSSSLECCQATHIQEGITQCAKAREGRAGVQAPVKPSHSHMDQLQGSRTCRKKIVPAQAPNTFCVFSK